MIKIRERRTGSKTRWQIDFSAPLGGQGPERRWRFNAPSFITSRSAAERWARDALARVLRGEPPAPTRPAREQRAAEAVVREQAERTAEREAATFAAWCEEYLGDCEARRVRATTVELRRAQLGHAIALFGARRVRDIGELDIARLRRALARYKPRTANGILAAVSACLKLAARFGYRGPVPEIERVRMAETMEESPEGRACSPEEFAVMLGAARHLGPAELATVLLAGDAGLRAGEIGALRWEDVDFRRGSIRVARTVVRLKGARTEHPTKGGRIRRVPASPRLLAALRELAEVPAADGYVLHDRQGALATGRTVEGTLRRVERRAKIRTFGPHALRHRFACDAVAAGVDLATLQLLLGHSSISTTAIYVRSGEREGRAAIDLLARHRETSSLDWNRSGTGLNECEVIDLSERNR